MGPTGERSASAARLPLRTADSIVSGQPVSVQEPAIAMARMVGALLRSRRTDAGKPRRFGVARNRASSQGCVFERWEKRLHFAPRERFELRRRLAEIFVGGAEAAAQIARLFFEDPLQRRFERRYEIAADASAVVPKMDVDDRIGIVPIEVRDAVALRLAENSFDLARRNRKHDGVELGVALRQSLS